MTLLHKSTLLIVALSSFALGCQSQDNSEKAPTSHRTEILEHRKELNAEFMDPATSPLTPEARKKFTSLKYFSIDSTYKVRVSFRRINDQAPFMMPHTNDFSREYQKYGEIDFELQSKTLTLSVYQSLELIKQEEYKDHLFIPFTDLSNEVTTYGGGRYLEFSIPKSEDIFIDFNLAYNPYCSYNGKYRCPIPPKENDLSLSINAGEKIYKKH